MAETCFSNYILVEGNCGNVVPSTGLYINRHLEGITLQKGANIAEGVTVKGVDLLNKCIENGIRRARKDLIKNMMGYVRFNSILEAHTYGCFATDYLSVSSGEKGVTITLDSNCRYTKIYINAITVKTNTTLANKQIKIVDGGTTTIKTVDLTAGVQSTINPNYKATNKEVSVQWDLSDIAVNNSNLNSCSGCGCSSSSNIYEDCGTCTNCDCEYMTANGSDGTSNTYGITVYATLVCDEDAFTCDISQWLSEAALYAAGISFILEYKAALRINAFTLYKEEDYNELRATWEDRYEAEIKTLSDKLPVYLKEIGGDCITCNSSRWVHSIP